MNEEQISEGKQEAVQRERTNEWKINFLARYFQNTQKQATHSQLEQDYMKFIKSHRISKTSRKQYFTCTYCKSRAAKSIGYNKEIYNVYQLINLHQDISSG